MPGNIEKPSVFIALRKESKLFADCIRLQAAIVAG